MKIFIGGYGGTGSRLVSNIFEQLGLNVEKEFCNVMYDWGAIPKKGIDEYFVDVFDRCFAKDDFEELFDYIDKNTEKDNYAIKHGHLMFIFDKLKKRYPECKTVFVNRNPIDAALKTEYIPHIKYGDCSRDERENMDKKIPFYINHQKIAMSNADLSIDYENLCINPHIEIEKIKRLVNSNFIFKDYSFIKTPSSFAIGSHLYSKYDLTKVKEMIYTNQNLTLRELHNNDSDLSFLLEIRNDESTRNQLENDSVFSLDECKTWYSNLKIKWKIIEVAGTPVGYLRFNDDDEVGCDIHPHHRRRGYARRAYEMFLKDVNTATLWVFEDNFAKNLYNSLGFNETKQIKFVRGKRYLKMRYGG